MYEIAWQKRNKDDSVMDHLEIEKQEIVAVSDEEALLRAKELRGDASYVVWKDGKTLFTNPR